MSEKDQIWVPGSGLGKGGGLSHESCNLFPDQRGRMVMRKSGGAKGKHVGGTLALTASTPHH